jgi:hypothetical protein
LWEARCHPRERSRCLCRTRRQAACRRGPGHPPDRLIKRRPPCAPSPRLRE